MRGRHVIGVLGVAFAAVTASGAAASATDGDDDNGKAAELAEAQFEVFLLTTTEFTPSDITCTRPPTRHAAGDLLCYALIAPRVSVAAVATLESPGVYRFTPLNKVDPADLGIAPAPTPAPESPEDPQQPDSPATEPAPGPAPAPEPRNATDAAILDRIDEAVAQAAGLGEVIVENNELVTSIDSLAYDPSTATLQVAVTTTATEPGVRDAIAFSITNIMAFLWEDDEPLRQPDATILPSFAVTVDGTTYTTPFDVMVRVADYTISQTEWLDIVTGQAAFRRAGRR